MDINVNITSKITGRTIASTVRPKQLLKMDEESLISYLDDNECSCNTEGGYSYCGCGDEFEEYILIVDGELVNT